MLQRLHLRHYLNTGLILLLCVTAGLAIYVLITGNFGWPEFKALLSALIIFAGGLNGVACLTCRQDLPSHWPAWVGVGLGALTSLLLLALLWLDVQSPSYWKSTSLALTATMTYTHSLLPVLVRLEGWQQRVLIPATRASGLALGALTGYAILSGRYTEWLVRSFSVLAILVGFFTLLLVILHRRRQSTASRLILEKMPDGRYLDSREGRYYRVTPVE